MKWLLILPALFLLFFLLKVFIGVFFPKKAGKQLLKNNLKRYGLPVETFPESFFDERVAHCMRTAEIMSSLGTQSDRKTTLFVNMLEGDSYNIYALYEEKRRKLGTLDQPSDPLFTELFECMRTYGLI